MQIVIDIPEEEYNECKMQVEMMKQEGMLIESLNMALKIHVANGKPLEEELHREKEQAYYLGYEDGRKSEWTAGAESEQKAKKARDIINDVMKADNIPYEGTDDR